MRGRIRILSVALTAFLCLSINAQSRIMFMLLGTIGMIGVLNLVMIDLLSK